MATTFTKLFVTHVTNLLLLTSIASGITTSSIAHCKTVSKKSNSIVWSKTGAMHEARRQHTSTFTLLKNGLVLVTGGMFNDDNKIDGARNIPSYCNTCELYNPATGTWSTTGSLQDKRVLHTATLLKNGLVLVVGGTLLKKVGYDYHHIACNTCELYNPATGTWSTTGSLQAKYSGHTATLLKNGLVLVVGGTLAQKDGGNGIPCNTCELYNPATGTWSTTGSIRDQRSCYTATLLKNGLVLVVGGILVQKDGDDDGIPCNTCELYNPATGTWSTTGSIRDQRLFHTATLLKNGLVLVVGGTAKYKIFDNCHYPIPCNTCELYNPATGTWSTTESIRGKQSGYTTALLKNGSVLIVVKIDKSNSNICQLYNPTKGTWSETSGPIFESDSANYTIRALLPNGSILATGGTSGVQLGRIH